MAAADRRTKIFDPERTRYPPRDRLEPLTAVAPVQRARMVDPALPPTLSRDQAAVALVRAELTARRDTAAVALAFEFAGRLQAELEALDWITGKQKVTQAPWG